MCNIVYEDNHLLIVVKPPNLLTQGDATGDDCLVERMKRYVKEKYQKPGAVYLGLVHRLDRPVGGLVALARTGKAAARLSEQLRNHAMRRDYLAVVTGADIVPNGKFSDWLLKNEQTGSVACVSPYTPDAQQAELHWQTLAANAQADTALVAVTLETGRKHQIRAQFAHAGHPIVQDMRYGNGTPGESIALWGVSLTLAHPTTHTTMTFLSRPQGKAFAQYSDAIDAYFAVKEAEKPE
jgi:23S rRNA pseudouridine1911/1915/1917 synthase